MLRQKSKSKYKKDSSPNGSSMTGFPPFCHSEGFTPEESSFYVIFFTYWLFPQHF